jgi:hypothetical protein
VAEIAGVDLRVLKGVATLDMDGSSTGAILQTDGEGDAVGARRVRWGWPQLALVGDAGCIGGCGDEDELQVGGFVGFDLFEELGELFALEVAFAFGRFGEADDLVELAGLKEEFGREEALHAGDVGERPGLFFDELLLRCLHDFGTVDAVGGEDAVGEFVDGGDDLVVLEVGADGWVVDEAFYAGGFEDLAVADSG